MTATLDTSDQYCQHTIQPPAQKQPTITILRGFMKCADINVRCVYPLCQVTGCMSRAMTLSLESRGQLGHKTRIVRAQLSDYQKTLQCTWKGLSLRSKEKYFTFRNGKYLRLKIIRFFSVSDRGLEDNTVASAVTYPWPRPHRDPCALLCAFPCRQPRPVAKLFQERV